MDNLHQDNLQIEHRSNSTSSLSSSYPRFLGREKMHYFPMFFKQEIIIEKLKTYKQPALEDLEENLSPHPPSS